jgi:undecaprenyl-diphosphatase
MEILRWLESIRTPFLDGFFSAVTHLGEETIFIVLGILIFWCVNKREGYYILSIGLIGTVVYQFLKLFCRIPRPWVQDESFTIVESARAEATGYSFPSGHTQTAVGLFGGVARWHKNLWLRIGCIILAALVALSRMYLGVHTPLDVGVAIVTAVVLIFVLYPLVHKATDKERTMRILFGAMTLLAVANVLYVSLSAFPADIDMDNLTHGTKNAYTMLGCIAGLWLSFEVESRYIRFETKSVWWVQVLKMVLGLALVLAVKEGFKIPLRAIFGTHNLGDAIRYFCMTAFAGCVWPLTFKWFDRLAGKKAQQPAE